MKQSKKQWLFISLLVVTFISGLNLKAQVDSEGVNNVTTREVRKNFYFDLGLANGSYQDLKFSSQRYSGSGIALRFGKMWTSEDYSWGLDLDLRTWNESAKTHDVGKTKVNNINLNAWYMRPLNDKWFVGGRLDILDGNIRSVNGLMNNGTSIIHGSHLFASAEYVTPFKERWKLRAGLDLGFLSYMNESNGFAFSAPQVATEGGDFNYQNNSLDGFFGIEFFTLESFGQLLNLRTHVELQGKKRFSYRYDWHLVNYEQIKGYPVTYGLHAITVRYNLTDNVKTKEIGRSNKK